MPPPPLSLPYWTHQVTRALSHLSRISPSTGCRYLASPPRPCPTVHLAYHPTPPHPCSYPHRRRQNHIHASPRFPSTSIADLDRSSSPIRGAAQSCPRLPLPAVPRLSNPVRGCRYTHISDMHWIFARDQRSSFSHHFGNTGWRGIWNTGRSAPFWQCRAYPVTPTLKGCQQLSSSAHPLRILRNVQFLCARLPFHLVSPFFFAVCLCEHLVVSIAGCRCHHLIL
jgi:hypothetical protein